MKSRTSLSILLAALMIVPAVTIYAQDLQPSWPPDTSSYKRKATGDDKAPGGKPALGPVSGPSAVFPNVFVRDPVVNNTDPNLSATDTFGDSEPAIAVNPINPSSVVITGFSGFTWTNPGTNPPGAAPLWFSIDGGSTWTKAFTIPSPTGVSGKFCPCDQTIDFTHGNRLSGSFLTVNPTNIYTGTTTDPSDENSFLWDVVKGQAQLTDFGAPNNADQPWLLSNSDPLNPAQDNLYTAYDDFSGCCSPVMHVSASYGTDPPVFTVDNVTGVSSPFINPGNRLGMNHADGTVYELYQVRIAPGADGVSQNINFVLNRSTDGGQTWGLNGSPSGIVVANADSTQPRPKFGTVNALLGGVDHVAADANTGDVYVVHGNRDAATGNNRLSIVRLTSDGHGGLKVASRAFVTGQVQAALPSVAVTSTGAVGVLYDTFDGFSASGFPIFSAHLAVSFDHAQTFRDAILETFLSPAKDNGGGRQRVLGDYQQLKAVGNTLYGTFTGNGVPFGRPFANTDAIFFKTTITH